MPKTETVLVSISIVVTAPEKEWPEDDSTDEDSAEPDFLHMIADRLSASVAALEKEPWFVENQGTTYHYLEIDEDSPTRHAMEKNAGRCARCGRWTSDYDRPDYLDLLMVGKTVDGKLLCDVCLFALGKGGWGESCST